MKTITIEGARRLLPKLEEARGIIERAFAEAVEAATSPGGQPETSPGDKSVSTAIANGRYYLRRLTDDKFDANHESLRTCFETLVIEIDRIHPLLALAEIDRKDLADLRAENERLRAIKTTEPKADTVADRQLAKVRDLFVNDIAQDLNPLEPDLIGKTERIADRIVETLRATGWRGESFFHLLQLRADLHDLKVHVPSGPGGAGRSAVEEIKRLRLKTDVDAAVIAQHEAGAIVDAGEISRLRAKVEARRVEAQGLIENAQTAAEEWKARALKAEAEVKTIEVPLLSADYPETLAGMIRASLPEEIRGSARMHGKDNRRSEVAQALADLVIDSLRHLGAQAAPALQVKSAPFRTWGTGTVIAENTPHGIEMSFTPDAKDLPPATEPSSSMEIEAVRQLAHELSKGAAENSGAIPQMLFAPIYLGLEDAIAEGSVVVKMRTRWRG